MTKKTPLYDAHIDLGGKMTPFAGYELPVQYGTGIIKEHNAVRNAAGLFDVSHMGEFILEGANVAETASGLLTNDISRLAANRARYSPMCYEDGGVVDDLLIYKLSDNRIMAVVNAANREKDFAWIKSRIPSGKATLTDISDKTALIALQGPLSAKILESLVASPIDEIPVKSYGFLDGVMIAGKKSLISRTGYTGEDGFEFYLNWDDAKTVFLALLDAGAPYGLLPCGLGARDTLRLEAAMPLYGHELSEDITPLEAGLGMFVKISGREFVGRQALVDMGEPKRKRVGLELIDKGIARERCQVLRGGAKIGETTSGTMSPLTGKAIAMALVESSADDDGSVEIDVRGRRLAARFVDMPFYRKGTLKN